MTIVPIQGPWETRLTVAGLDRSIALNPDGHAPEFIRHAAAATDCSDDVV
jgi:hypothetical protein